MDGCSGFIVDFVRRNKTNQIEVAHWEIGGLFVFDCDLRLR